MSSNFAIVVINSSAVTVTQTFNLTNFTAATVTPWITSATMSLSNQTAVPVSSFAFTYPLPPMSVVTFTGQGLSLAPALTAVSNQTINAGVRTLSLTNVATCPLSPPDTLFFSLPAGPTYATLDSASGIVSWRPHVNQAGTTNQFSVVVTDTTTSLSATNNFQVIVNPLTQPTQLGAALSGTQLQLMANGPQGPDYTLLSSTNLTTWQTVYTTNSLVVPVTFEITNIGALPKEFYRIQLGP